MATILVATDFTPSADPAVRRAAALARGRGAALVVVHVLEPGGLDQAAAEAALAALTRGYPELAGLDCRTRVEAGAPVEAIVRAARATGAELVVVGAGRPQVLRTLFVGTTAERVLRSGDLPVLVVQAEPEASHGLTLAAVDLSDCSRHALTRARALGLLDGTRLVLLHVFDAMARGMLAYAGVGESEIADYVADLARRAERETGAFLRGLGLEAADHAVLVQEGETAARIVAAAEEIGPDLLIVGTRPRGALPKLLVGSVAEEILQRVACDVLVVPCPPERTGEPASAAAL